MSEAHSSDGFVVVLRAGSDIIVPNTIVVMRRCLNPKLMTVWEPSDVQTLYRAVGMIGMCLDACILIC